MQKIVRIKEIGKYIFLEPNLEQAELIFVFGTRHKEASERVSELYHSGHAKKILVSGGENRITGENEAEEMSRALVCLGVIEDDIISEDKSINTLENVLFSEKIIGEKLGWENIKKILVVTKHYHIRRAMMTLKKHFPESVQLLPAPYDMLGFDKDNWYETDSGQEKVMGEWRKIKEYLAKGDIEELD
jgi:uncharacterized SAM-binding protein YcdF (DUF218 family)